MLHTALQRFTRVAFVTLLTAVGQSSQAQQNGLLYDPEPPAESAYVRVLSAGHDGALDVAVDGRPRIRALAAGTPSDYMILPAGKHVLSLKFAGTSAPQRTATLEVVRGRALTVAFMASTAGAAPIIFEDKANTNKLKALLAVYHLDRQAGPLDIATAGGGTRVFSALAPGASASIAVNPITIDLIATLPLDKVALARTSLAMTAGATYSLLILPGSTGQPTVHAVENRVERFTGK